MHLVDLDRALQQLAVNHADCREGEDRSHRLGDLATRRLVVRLQDIHDFGHDEVGEEQPIGRGEVSRYNWDSARVVEVRCEPGIGGRLLEIYNEAHGDMLERARITAWEPGARLAWQSSVDDVRIEVRFDPVDDGTRVRVAATIPAGGRDEGGTSFVRVTPPWFAAWCARRDRVPHELRDTARLGLAVHYSNPGTAARWLHEGFGFEPAGTSPRRVTRLATGPSSGSATAH